MNKAGFVLLASLMMTTALPAFAQTEVGNAPLPEVEVDGSVLQQLDPSAGTTQSLIPIQLTPPSVTRQATSNSGPTLTSDMDPSGVQDVAIQDEPVKDTPSIVPPPERVVAKVIVPADAPPTPIETRSVQAISTPPVEAPPVQNIAAHDAVEPAPAKEAKSDDDGESFLHHFVTAPVKSLFGSSKKTEPMLADIPAPPVPAVASVSQPDQIPAQALATRAGMVSARPTDLADESRPAIIPQKKASKPVEVAAAKPAPKIDLSPVGMIAAAPVKPVTAAPLPSPDANAVSQVVMDVPNAPMPTAPLKPVAKVIIPPVKPVVAVADHHEGKDLVEPPKVMAEAADIKAPVAKPVLFPVSSKSKTRGEIDPQITKVDSKTPIAPVLPRPDTKQALNTAMSDDSVIKPQQVAVDIPAPKQAAPEIIYRNVPVPKPRPNVVVASKDFVEQARRTYEDTYKVIKRDGDQMPAVGAQKVAKEDLAAPANTAPRNSAPVRMSVADIAADPLASKLVAMTPDDIATTLNSMAPAAGTPARAIEEEVATRSTNRVRIVRENGNWVPRKPVEPTQVASTDAGQGTASSLPADGRFNLAFQSNTTDLPSASYGEMDSGVVNALRSDSNARVQIVAYASAADGKDTTAKRTSLARALSIRSYMISKGIDATRVDVRAMGLQQDAKAAADQVQMIVVPADAKKS